MSQVRAIPAMLAAVMFIAPCSFAGDTEEEIAKRIGLGDPIAGKDKSSLCQGCHGDEGHSVVPSFPKLAGQYADYISRQINNFQQGNRKDPTMSEMAASIDSAQDLYDIAAYFASQKQMVGTPTKNVLGEKIARNYGCINCHGENGKSQPDINPIFPVIGGQHKDYLVKQLHDFKTGDRDTDISGTMGDITKRMTSAEIDAVAEYLSGQ